MMVSGASRGEQRDGEGLFGQVNTQDMHVGSPFAGETCSWHNLVLTCWDCRSRILHGLAEHVDKVCQQTNLSNGVKHRGLSRFLSTQCTSTARRIPVSRRTWSFVVAKNPVAFQTRLSARVRSSMPVHSQTTKTR